MPDGMSGSAEHDGVKISWEAVTGAAVMVTKEKSSYRVRVYFASAFPQEEESP